MDDNSKYTILRLRKTNLTPQFFIQVSVPNYECERSYICALDKRSILPPFLQVFYSILELFDSVIFFYFFIFFFMIALEIQ